MHIILIIQDPGQVYLQITCLGLVLEIQLRRIKRNQQKTQIPRLTSMYHQNQNR